VGVSSALARGQNNKSGSELVSLPQAKGSYLKTDSKRLLAAACVVGLCVTGILFIRRPPGPKQIALVEAPETIQQTDLEPVTHARKSLLARPQPSLSHLPAATAIAPAEPPEDPDEAREWARKNPHDALTWVLNAPAGEPRDTVMEIVCAHMAESNPAEAVSLAERYAGGCSNLLENMLHQWAGQNEPLARAYAINKPPGEERDRLFSRVAFTRSKENPAEAAKLVAEWISPGEVQNEAAISVLHQWALRDPHAALAWAQLFPENSLRDRALTEIGNTSSSP
jgi:hypothetical protein